MRMREAHEAYTEAKHALEKQQEDRARARGGYLRSLDELLGPPPPEATWETQWLELRMAVLEVTRKNHPETWRQLGPWRDVDVNWNREELLEWMATTNTAEMFQKRYRERPVATLCERGWSQEDARLYGLLSAMGPTLAHCLRERKTETAACVRALYDCMCRRTLSAKGNYVPHSRASIGNAAQLHLL